MPIRLLNVYAGYSRKGTVIRGASLNLDGKNVILGPNGSGKTTLFRVLLGLSVHSKGSILVDDYEVERISGLPGLIATNLHEVYGLVRVPVKDLAELYLELGGGKLSHFLRMVEEFEVEDMLGKRLDELSAGQKKLVCNFMALAMKAKYTLLDEPFENLDPARRAKMCKTLIEKGDGVIMNTHATWLLDKFSNWTAYLMFEGKVYGPIIVDELIKSSIVEGEAEGFLLKFEAGGKRFSLVKGVKGITITSIDSLDRLFEVAL